MQAERYIRRGSGISTSDNLKNRLSWIQSTCALYGCAYPFHETTAWIAVGNIAREAIDVVYVQAREVDVVQRVACIVAKGVGVRIINGELVTKITIFYEGCVSLVGNQWVWEKILHWTLIIIVCVCPGISHLCNTQAFVNTCRSTELLSIDKTYPFKSYRWEVAHRWHWPNTDISERIFVHYNTAYVILESELFPIMRSCFKASGWSKWEQGTVSHSCINSGCPSLITKGSTSVRPTRKSWQIWRQR